MTETPDTYPAEPEEDEKAKDSLAGDVARKLEPALDEPSDDRDAKPRTGD